MHRPTRSARRRVRASLGALVATSLLLAGCGGDDESEPDADEPSARTTANGGVFSSVWPLTGLDAKGDESTAQSHPVLVVKVDNSGKTTQEGLSDADLVVEELVEGGTTRLAAFFYSRLPDTVGPVRSMRASDLGIVPPGARIVTSGAAPVTINRVRQAGITFYGEGAAGFYRDSSRPAPYNLFNRLPELARKAKVEETRPDDYLQWGTAKDLPKGQPARSITADFGNHATQWSWDGKRWNRTNSFAAQGDEFPTDTVLALRVRTGDAGYKDPSGSFVPETKLEGTGPAMLFHDGRVVRGQWSKKGLTGPLRLKAAGKPLEVPAGHVFIELVPLQGGNVTVGR